MAENDVAAKEPAWITPTRDLSRVERAVQNPYLAADALVKWLRDGLVGALAKHVVVFDGGAEQKRNTDILVRAYVWEHLKGDAKSQSFWSTENLEVWLDHGQTRVSFYGLRFDTNAISELLPELPKAKPIGLTDALVAGLRKSKQRASQPEPVLPPSASGTVPPVKQSPNLGGRPRKDYWDDLWIEMCRQIHSGDLDLSTISVTKIANAMMEWSEVHHPDDALSDSAAKRAARRLVQALKHGVQN